MSTFESEVSLSVKVPDRELQRARGEIENSLGSVQVDVNNGRATRPDGGMAGGATLAGGAVIEELGDQTDILEDIFDELNGGVGGGGGGLGGGGGDGGILPDLPGADGGGPGILEILGVKKVFDGVKGKGGGILGRLTVPTALAMIFGPDIVKGVQQGQGVAESTLASVLSNSPGLLAATSLTTKGIEGGSDLLQDVTGLDENTESFDEFLAGDTAGRDVNPDVDNIAPTPDVTSPFMPVDFSGGYPGRTTDPYPNIDTSANYSDIEIPEQFDIGTDKPLTIDYGDSGGGGDSDTNVSVNNQITVQGSSEPSQRDVQRMKREIERVVQQILGDQGTIDEISTDLQRSFRETLSG